MSTRAHQPPPAELRAEYVGFSGPPTARNVTFRITNTGSGDANDVRLDGLTFTEVGAGSKAPLITGRDPNRLPVPVAANIPPGGSATVDVQLDVTNISPASYRATVPFSANGGRTEGTLTANISGAVHGQSGK